MPSTRPTVRLTEIYASVQGESTHVGKPCVFVRLARCNLRCVWCDSAFTFTGGTVTLVASVLEQVRALGIHTVEVTGGEPLLQPGVIPLMEGLLAAGHEVLLETSGSLTTAEVPEGVHVVLDLKAPDSGESGANLWENLERLRPTDEVKIVLASRRDYEWALEVLRTRAPQARVPVLLSTAYGLLDARELAEWMVADRVPARLQLQLHKVLWPPDERGV